MLIGQVIALLCLAFLNDGVFYYGYILGNGIVSGLYNVLMAVTWPRFYGRENLGRITGFVMAIIVFASALGPTIFSFSATKLGSYSIAIFGLAAIVSVITVFSFKAENPQSKFDNSK
jgi:MFS family permease